MEWVSQAVQYLLYVFIAFSDFFGPRAGSRIVILIGDLVILASYIEHMCNCLYLDGECKL